MNVNLSVGVDELSIIFVSLTMSQISRLAWAIDFRMPMREKSPRRLLEHLKVSWLTEGCQVVDYDHASWRLVRKKELSRIYKLHHEPNSLIYDMFYMFDL